MKYKITYPLADTISVVSHLGSHSTHNTSEIAFFKRGGWIKKIIPEFKGYEFGASGDTMIYAYVPNLIIEEFIDKYRA